MFSWVNFAFVAKLASSQDAGEHDKCDKYSINERGTLTHSSDEDIFPPDAHAESPREALRPDIIVYYIDDVSLDDVIKAARNALGVAPEQITATKWRFGEKIVETICEEVKYGEMGDHTPDRLTAILYVGRARARGYREVGATIQTDLQMTIRDINRDYTQCIKHIADNIKMLDVMLAVKRAAPVGS